MKKLKRLVMSLLLSKQEKDVIWNALWFSNHTYRRRGNVDGATAVQMVMNSVGNLLGVKEKLYTKAEINEIISNLIKSAYDRGKAIGRREIVKTIDSIQRYYADSKVNSNFEKLKEKEFEVNFVPGVVLSSEKCAKCEKRENCAVRKFIFTDEEKETIKSEEKAVPQSPKEASKQSNAADDGVNYEQD